MQDLVQFQADEQRVKRQGSIVWMALAMMVKTRLWLGGEVSEQRDMTLIRRLIERVRRCALPRPLLVCTDGLCAYIRAIRETLRDPVPTGTGWPPRPWRNVMIAQVVKRYERRRVVETERRIIDGTPARVETLRRRSQDGEGVINPDPCHGGWKPRTARRFTVYKNCPLATLEDRLFFLLVYLKTSALPVVQGRLFGMGQSKANQWIHVLLPALLAALRPRGAAPARSLTALAQRLGVSEADAATVVDSLEKDPAPVAPVPAAAPASPLLPMTGR